MKSNKYFIFTIIFIAGCIFIACKSNPDTVSAATKGHYDEPQIGKEPSEDTVVATFGEVKITQKDYVEAKSEIEEVVDELNNITATSNYDKWLRYLSNEYIRHFSDRDVLKSASEALPVQGIKLSSLRDYFKYVFVPSRKNVRVDDIKYVSATVVKVIMQTNNSSLLVYMLEKVDTNWKLVTKS